MPLPQHETPRRVHCCRWCSVAEMITAKSCLSRGLTAMQRYLYPIKLGSGFHRAGGAGHCLSLSPVNSVQEFIFWGRVHL